MKRISTLVAVSVLSLFASIAMAHPGGGMGIGGGMSGGAAGMGATMGMGSMGTMASMSHGSFAATAAMNVNGTTEPAMPNNPIAQAHVIANRANATMNDGSTTDNDSTTDDGSTVTNGSTTTTTP